MQEPGKAPRRQAESRCPHRSRVASSDRGSRS
jgi:hypothetical protein